MYAILLSDVIGDPPDMIASGPAYPDSTTSQQALELVKQYHLKLTPRALELLGQPLPKELPNVTTVITGSVSQLCRDGAARAEELGYRTCAADGSSPMRGPGSRPFSGGHRRLPTQARAKTAAYIAGGETVVHLTGHGLGGRNQELALAAAPGLAGLDAALASVGSDGTDGPTDAAGGIVDGATASVLEAQGRVH